MIVRFAVVCDRCGKRGEEYGGGFSCRGECERDLGPECALEQDEEHGRGICPECKEEES